MAAVLEPYQIPYSDLLQLTSDDPPTSSSSHRSITSCVMRALGPDGPGLLAITHLPSNVSFLRSRLLPLARRLALLHDSDRKRILKEHGLGSDVPLKKVDGSVSSFAMMLKYEGRRLLNRIPEAGDPSLNSLVGVDDADQFKGMGDCFKELGSLMIELGLRVARICDTEIGGEELERSLLESFSAKARLIHYRSSLDNRIIQKNAGRKSLSGDKGSDLWQQWHYDYGVLTVLTAPLFMVPDQAPVVEDDSFPASFVEGRAWSGSEHSYLQILYPARNEVVVVSAPPESFLVQVGEAADIISGGKLRPSLHSVALPRDRRDLLSRETFVVFLQPSWSRRLYLVGYSRSSEEDEVDVASSNWSTLVPPLRSRLKDGMTFAEFARETTKQYYGCRGLQSNKGPAFLRTVPASSSSNT